MDGKCDLPTSDNCQASWKSKKDDKVVQVKMYPVSKICYPETYKSRWNSHLSTYKRQQQDYGDFPSYETTWYKDKYTLFLDTNGSWIIEGKEGTWRSNPKGYPYPPNNDMWEYWDYDKKTWIHDPLTVMPSGMKENHICVKDNINQPSSDTGLILAIAIPLSVISICSVIAVFVLVIRKKKMEEEPTIDRNLYYGDDRNVVSIRDHRVVDNNDYYEK